VHGDLYGDLCSAKQKHTIRFSCQLLCHRSTSAADRPTHHSTGCCAMKPRNSGEFKRYIATKGPVLTSPLLFQLFLKVLLVCDSMGLIGREMFAIDGCKLFSNTSKE
jgi:hypothetical protein